MVSLGSPLSLQDASSALRLQATFDPQVRGAGLTPLADASLVAQRQWPPRPALYDGPKTQVLALAVVDAIARPAEGLCHAGYGR